MKSVNQLQENRNMLICKRHLGLRIWVSNGKYFEKIYISKKMLGYKLGQFVFTKKMGHTIHFKVVRKQQVKKKK